MATGQYLEWDPGKTNGGLRGFSVGLRVKHQRHRCVWEEVQAVAVKTVLGSHFGW